jgi:hypothetical protein
MFIRLGMGKHHMEGQGAAQVESEAASDLWDEAMERRLSVREFAEMAKLRGIPLRDAIPL